MVENIIVAVIVLIAVLWAGRAIYRKIRAARDNNKACPTEECSTCPHKGKHSG